MKRAIFLGSVYGLAAIGILSSQALAIIKCIKGDPWYLVIFYSILALGIFAIRPLFKHLKGVL